MRPRALATTTERAHLIVSTSFTFRWTRALIDHNYQFLITNYSGPNGSDFSQIFMRYPTVSRQCDDLLTTCIYVYILTICSLK